MIDRIYKVVVALAFIPSMFLAQPNVFESYPPAKAASDVSKDNLIVVIGASWCSPCRKMHKEIEANASAYKGVNLAFVDYDSSWGKRLYKGSSVPAIIKFKWNGKSWDKEVRVGYQTQRNLLRWVKQ